MCDGVFGDIEMEVGDDSACEGVIFSYNVCYSEKGGAWYILNTNVYDNSGARDSKRA